jgi:hypothetical protein
MDYMNIPYLFGLQKHLLQNVINVWQDHSISLSSLDPCSNNRPSILKRYLPLTNNPFGSSPTGVSISDNGDCCLYSSLTACHLFVLRSVFAVLSSVVMMPPLFVCAATRLVGGIDQQVGYILFLFGKMYIYIVVYVYMYL